MLQATKEYKGYKVSRGKPFPFGSSVDECCINFAISSHHATSAILVLFKKGESEPFVEIPFFDEYKIGNVYAMRIFDLDFKNIEYGYRFDGKYSPKEGELFDKSKILLDPYAKVIYGNTRWGERDNLSSIYPHRAGILTEFFNWEDDKFPQIPIEDSIIYEMHVRGFTQDSSSKVTHRGTYSAIIEKIPYLKELGINAIELMPIFEFDELEYVRINPNSKRLINYWGYSTVGFFAPKAGYAINGEIGGQVNELKTLVKELHKNGIEIILDVVFNHTAEGDERGSLISFKGIDNRVYYMLTPDGGYLNFSGCGNTLNCNHPTVREMVLESLRYWVSAYHIDGFRFDLASILGRDSQGVPLSNPPLLEALANDPILAKTKLIAEAWDAGGLYQVGNFPAYGRFAEWNGKYRDTVRKFLKSDFGCVSDLALRVQGSPDLYLSRGSNATINFITSHDGFTLNDLFSYNEKHNLENGEDNRDGETHNNSYNWGVEGESSDEVIVKIRKRHIKNALTILMVSQGVPMLLMGDEMARSQNGNNNAYCHDSELTWLNWDLIQKNSDIFRFAKLIIKFRNNHPVLRGKVHLTGCDYMDSGCSDITFHGTLPWKADFSDGSRVFAFMLCGEHAKEGEAKDNYIYVAMNMHTEALKFHLPKIKKRKWYLSVNTFNETKEDILDIERLLENQKEFTIREHSVIVLVGK